MQTHAQAAYLGGRIAAELEGRGFAGKDGFTPAAMNKAATHAAGLPVHFRHALAKSARDADIVTMVGEFAPPAGPTPTAEQGCFWLGYYHQKLARTLPDTFPAKLAAMIAAAGHATPAAFAAASGIAPQTLHNLLAGHRRPGWDTVQRLAVALGVPTDAFRDRPAPE